MQNGFKYIWELLKDLRYRRVFYYWILFVAGIALSSGHFVADFFSVGTLLITLAIIFSCLSCIVTNNIYDLSIDQISNPKRPLVTGSIPLKPYRVIGRISFLSAFILAGCVSGYAVFVVSAFVLNYYLYSAPPLRLKTLPVLSKIIISINSVLMLMLGYGFVHQSLRGFPVALAIYILVFFTLAANFIDLKDFKGDRAAGIKTLPVLLGIEKAQTVCAIFMALAYLAICIFLGWQWISLIILIFGITQFFLMISKNYNEAKVFGVLLTSILVLVWQFVWMQ